MSQIAFTKMHGLGNCYVYIDGWKHQLSDHQLISLAQSVSNISTGIGSDGLILMGPSAKATVRMRIFNKDGSEGKNCGNGLRCVAKYAFEQKWTDSSTLTIETGGGIVKATISHYTPHEASVGVDMGPPILERGSIPMLGTPKATVVNEPFKIAGHTLALTAVSMGNPHAVFFVPNISQSLHDSLGPIIEKDARFPEKVNVEFISMESPRSIQFRVWERGSGITQACGTGACAAVVAAILNGYSKRDEEIVVHLQGGDLSIRWASNNHIYMTGPATTIATGFLMLNH